MKLIYAGCSRRGLVRRTNEDAYLMRATGQAGLFLVADGIGGRSHGEVVSAMLRDGYDAWFQRRVLLPGTNPDFQSAASEIREVLLEQNREVIRRFGALSSGSTLVLLFVLRERYLYLSSGDSRIYQGRGLSVKQITVDDTYENWEGHPARLEPAKMGKLVGAVGIHPSPQFTLGTGVLRRGDRFFLCSDGVYRYIAAQSLRAKLRFGRNDPERLVDSIAAEVEDGGAGDNYSMVYVRIGSI